MTVEMKERFLESLAILLAGLFSAERPRPWQLGDAVPKRDSAAEPSNEACPRTSNAREN
jgi:hypothetical protein